MSFPPSSDHNPGVVSYAYTIEINNVEIGALQRFTPSSRRAAERVREIRASSGNKTKALVPGRENIEIVLDRVVIFKKPLIEYFGEVREPVPNVGVLFSSVRNGITIKETLYNPQPAGSRATAPSQAIRTISYNNCMPQAWSKTIDQGTTLIVESMTVAVQDTSVSRSAA
jgi:hypothetical protein